MLWLIVGWFGNCELKGGWFFDCFSWCSGKIVCFLVEYGKVGGVDYDFVVCISVCNDKWIGWNDYVFVSWWGCVLGVEVWVGDFGL